MFLFVICIDWVLLLDALPRTRIPIYICNEIQYHDLEFLANNSPFA